jgi:uncharacterized repeat protein (TIGR01451 family)
VAAVLLVASASAAPPGAQVFNTASFEYTDVSGQPASFDSNQVELTVAVIRTPAIIELLRITATGNGVYQEPVGPSACQQGGVFVDFGDAILPGIGAIDPTVGQDTTQTASYNLGEPLFLRLDDADQNVDYQVIDTATVTVVHDDTSDQETIRLTETGPDTGIFVGFVPTSNAPPVSGDCVLEGIQNTSVRVTYTDPADTLDTAEAEAMLDPVSRVFGSQDGSSVDNVVVQLVDAVSGGPAIVYGNDGVSTFPATITTGSTVTDSSGASYTFGPGEFRFPLIPDGDYRFVVTPPTGFAFPSSRAEQDLQALPGAPYSLGPASFGSQFTQSGNEPFAWDLPVDPRSTALFLQKQTTTTTAAAGDFVRYELLLENSSGAGPATEVRVTDQLPPGMRFVGESASVDGADVPDPSISPDGLSLEFNLADLAPGVRSSIAYVVEIIGGSPGEELVNRAFAEASAGLVSNEATAIVRLREDLFQSTGTIIGRVVEGECGAVSHTEEQGVADVRVYLEDGRYAITDAGGRFHFEGLTPGTHVAQLDTFTVPDYFNIIGCNEAAGFAGAADSQFVKLNPGGLLRADFYLRRKPRPVGRIDLELRNLEADSAEQADFELDLQGVGNVSISNIDVMILLPDGVSYVPGSMRIDGQDLGNPRVRDTTLSMALDDRKGNWSSRVRFRANIDPQVSGELVTRALARFDSPIADRQETPVAETKMIREPAVSESDGYVLNLRFAVLSAELSEDDKRQLDMLVNTWRGVRDIQIWATGHSDSQRIAARNRHLFADNYALSLARAQAAAAYVAGALAVPANAVEVDGHGPDEPVADNATAAGRQENRRVDMILSGVRPRKPSFLEVSQASSGTLAVPTKGAIPGTEADRKKNTLEIDVNVGLPASQVEPAIDSLQPGIEMLLPERKFQPAIPVTKVSIQHEPRQKVVLFVNNVVVDPVNFDTLALNTARTVAVSRWQGVDLEDGANRIRAVVTNADGSRAKVIKRTIHYAGPAARGEVVADLSNLVADGKTRPVIAVRLFDTAGRPSRAGTVGTYRVADPYRSWWDVESARKNELVAIGPREPVYRVGSDGIALIELEPTTRTGEVTVKLRLANNREQELRAWLTPAEREWILVGFAEGTAAYNTLSDNIGAAQAAGHEESYTDDGRVAFFAKGSIRGDYLLTLAYDSARDRGASRDRFETVIDPAAYYPLYADTSEQRFEAPSQRKLYVKLERRQFNALFGDFNTGLSVTDLSRYERRMNGFKSDYRGDVLAYTAFAAESNQGFHRDELRGDGTSGMYRLSRAPLIANSELVRIEVRDRIDTGRVISETRLARYLDYHVDPLEGTLFFKQPVPSRDLDFNPVYIVVEYESNSAGSEELVAGGRISAHSTNDRVEVGVTHVRDDSMGTDAKLSGVDFRWQINDQTEVRVEAASTRQLTGTGYESGKARQIEFEHNSENLEVRAHVADIDDEFGLGYQSAAEKGVRRLGVDARARINDEFSLEGEAAWQQRHDTLDVRNLARAAVRYDRSTLSASLGVTHAKDNFKDGDERSSQLAEVRIAKKVLGDRLTLRAGGSTSLSGDSDNVDFPTRTVLGADYRILRGVDLVAEYEDASGSNIDATTSRLGVKASPWTRGQVNAFVTEQITEFGPRLFANVGLLQGFQLNERWTLDIGFDQTDTLVADDARMFDSDRELVSGSLAEDFTAMYAGAMYSADAWSANSRIEYRDAESEKRHSVLFGWYREPGAGHGLSAALRALSSDRLTGDKLTTIDLRVGWAWRPADSNWSFLDRADVIIEDAVVGAEQINRWRIINNFNANRRFGAVAQLSLQYAAKYVRDKFDDDTYSGYTDLVGIDVRRGFRGRWDVGLNTSIRHSYRAETMDYGVGADVGYRLLDNMWLTLGYNVKGFYDGDFIEARYTAQGPYLRFSIKSSAHILRRITGQRP